MQTLEKLKDLRDALWQAAIESKIRFGEESVDPYSRPLPEIVSRLEAQGALAAADARLLSTFLQDYDIEDAESLPQELPDEIDTELSRIIAHLRSIRGISV